VINIPREDFSLRTETTYLFHQLDIEPKHLLFITEIESKLRELSSKNRIRWILVDHNILAQHQSHFLKDVEEIVDHHKDEKLFDHVTHSKYLIETVGSCTTLVAQKYLQQDKFLKTLSEVEREKICRILVATILLDTINLDPKHKKVTPKDEDIVKQLSAIAKYSKDFLDKLFNKLQDERYDQSSLGTNDLLRCDYKQFTMGKVEVGISSVKVSTKEWLAKDPSLLQEFEKYLVSRKLNLLCVMTAFYDKSNKFFREVMIFTKKKDLFQPVVEYLLKKTDLELSPIEEATSKSLTNDTVTIAFYNQGNTGASRKQLQPFLADFYKS